MEYITTTLSNLLQQTAFLNLTFGNIVMIFVALIFLYLAIGKGFEPLLLLPISFGMLLVNIYPDIMRSRLRCGIHYPSGENRKRPPLRQNYGASGKTGASL